MFLKKLFGKSSPAAETLWLNDGWIRFSYPSRHGTELIGIELDPSYLDPAARTGLNALIRITFPLLPDHQSSNTAPNAEGQKALKALEDNLLKALKDSFYQGKILARLHYEGIYEWVIVSGEHKEVCATLSKWAATQSKHAIDLWTAEGWDYYDDYLSPTPAERLQVQTQTQIAQLIKEGTKTDAFHRFTHTFTGPDKQLERLKPLILEMDRHWLVDLANGQMKINNFMKLDAAAINASVAKLYDLANSNGCDYKGWTSLYVKERWLSPQVKDGFVEYMHDNGAVYKGDYKSGMRHGKGTILYPEGVFYTGDWLAGKRTGQGLLRWTAKEWYEGDFVDGKSEGQGVFHFSNGNVYTGSWKNDDQNGIGTLVWSNGDHYIGEWADGKRNGQGRIVYKNQHEWYEGGFKDSQLHGESYDFVGSGDNPRIRYAIWENGKIAQTLTLPPLQEGTFSWNTLGEPSADLAATLRELARQAIANHRKPCLFLSTQGMPPSYHLKYYTQLPAFQSALKSMDVLEIDKAAYTDALKQLGIPDSAILVRLDLDGKYSGKCIDSPVWHFDRMTHAADKLNYFLM